MPNSTPASQRGRLFSALHNLTDELSRQKEAAAGLIDAHGQRQQTATGQSKQAAPTPADPGGYQGPTTHPTKNVANNVQAASEGARSSENAADVKADQGSPGVDSTAEAKPGADQQDKQQLNIGTQQSATGEDPSVEDAYKGTKDDPGTSHPARTDTGEKYSSCSHKEARDRAFALANDLLADLANGFGEQLRPQTKQAQAASPSAASASSQPSPATSTQPSLADAIKQASAALARQPDASQAMQEGYALAAVLGLTKDAAVHNVAECLDQTMRDANTDADLLGSFLVTLAQQNKQAADDGAAGEGEDHSKPGDETSGAGEAAGSNPPPDTSTGGPPVSGGPAGAMGGTPPGLEALLAGGGDTGEASLASQPPSEEEALQELVAALEELGIPIEALAQAGDAMGAGGEMGGNAAGGGVPGGDPAAAGGGPKLANARQHCIKLANAARAFRLSGKYQMKSAEPGTRSRALRESMKGYVRELLGV